MQFDQFHLILNTYILIECSDLHEFYFNSFSNFSFFAQFKIFLHHAKYNIFSYNIIIEYTNSVTNFDQQIFLYEYIKCEVLIDLFVIF